MKLPELDCDDEDYWIYLFSRIVPYGMMFLWGLNSLFGA
jgi:hypothetical protein